MSRLKNRMGVPTWKNCYLILWGEVSEIDKYLIRKLMVCLAGAFIYASGVVVVTKAELGISPISSAPYALTFVINQSLGACVMWLNVLLIMIQKLVMKREYTFKVLILQVAISIVFSLFIDLSMILWGGFAPQFYLGKIAYLLFGCFILALGMSLVVMANFVVLPGEGAVKCIAKIFRLEFGTAKIVFDCTMVAMALFISLVFLDQIAGVREGTVISAFMIGTNSRWVMGHSKSQLEIFLGKQMEAVPSPAQIPK